MGTGQTACWQLTTRCSTLFSKPTAHALIHLSRNTVPVDRVSRPGKGKPDAGVAEDTCVEFTYYCKAFTSFGLYKNIIYSKTPPHSELIDGKDLNEVFFARHDSDSHKMVNIYKPIDKNWYIRIQYFP